MTYLEKSFTNDNLTRRFDTIHQSIHGVPRAPVVAGRFGFARRATPAGAPGWKGRRGSAVRSGWRCAEPLEVKVPPGLKSRSSALTDIRGDATGGGDSCESGPQTSAHSHLRRRQPERRTGKLNPSGFSRQVWSGTADPPDRLLEESVLSFITAPRRISQSRKGRFSCQSAQRFRAGGQKSAGCGTMTSATSSALTTWLEQHNPAGAVHAIMAAAGIESLVEYSRWWMRCPGHSCIPEMDVYETMRAIRQIAEFRTLPYHIAVRTVPRPLKGDRQSARSRASDYPPSRRPRPATLPRFWRRYGCVRRPRAFTDVCFSHGVCYTSERSQCEGLQVLRIRLLLLGFLMGSILDRRRLDEILLVGRYSGESSLPGRGGARLAR